MFKDKINSNSNKTEAENPNIELKEIIVKNEELLIPNIDQEKKSLINDDQKHDIEQPKILDPEQLDPEQLDPEQLDPEQLDPEQLDPEQLEPDSENHFRTRFRK